MPSLRDPEQAVKVFISYAHQDQEFLEQLEKHLVLLKREGLIVTWSDRKIDPGAEWSNEIREALRESQILLVLVSPDYIASSYIWERELVEVLERSEEDNTRILPIVLRPVDWTSTPLANWQAVPRAGRSVVEMRSTDEAWLEVAQTLRRFANELLYVPEVSAPTAPAPQARLALYEVFKPSGIPTVTFVEPERFSALKLSLSQPGRGLVIEGPSGIGKTTALKKAVDQLTTRPDVAPGDVELLSARRPADIEHIKQLSDNHKGIIAIDDFHRLTPELRASVADYLKFLADYEVEDRKVVVVGIPRTGERLVEVAFDVATRIDVYKMGRVPDDLIVRMLELGEAALNVRFSRQSEIVSVANGSLNIAQLLCFQLCALQGVEKTREDTWRIQTSLESSVARVIEQVEPKFRETARRFVSLGGRRDYSYAEILRELAQSEDGFLSFPLLEDSRPDLKPAANRFVEGDYMQMIYEQVPDAANHLLWDPGVPALVIDDPQLSFYLLQTPKGNLLRSAGKSTATTRDHVFISYSHLDAEWLERLRVHLKPLERIGMVSIWDDSKIKVGRIWRDEIRSAIDASRVAVLLVSANFLASDFIMDNELPPLLETAEDDGAIIVPVILSPSRYRQTPALERFQSANSPDSPLAGMSFNEQEEVLLNIANWIDDALSTDSKNGELA